jgi:GNAT superfamily N-acetyltransferase
MAHFETIAIRPAQLEDRAALIAILHNTFERTWLPELTAAAAEAYRQGDRPAEYVDARGLEFHVATRGGVVAGFVHWEGDFVHALHVHSDHERTGVGSALMDVAEGEIARAGHSAARLETDTFNTRSQAFYSARGYRETDRYPDLEWNSNLTTLLFEKGLDKA